MVGVCEIHLALYVICFHTADAESDHRCTEVAIGRSNEAMYGKGWVGMGV